MKQTSAVSLAERPLFLLASVAHLLAQVGGGGTENAADRGYTLLDGVAVIGIRGALSNRSGDWLFGGSYEDVRCSIDAALADPACRAILLDIDSPGGEVAGAMETSSFIRNAAAKKPIVGFVDGVAASAAYALASGAQEIVVAPSATLGSIGVVMLHWDMSKYFAGVGLTPTLLQSGAYKGDGFPTKPLDRGAASRLQRTLDAHYGHFVETVGAHRPTLGERGARATEAGVYVGRDAVAAKLADRLGTLADARAAALARAGGAGLKLSAAPPSPRREIKGSVMPLQTTASPVSARIFSGRAADFTSEEQAEIERGRAAATRALGTSDVAADARRSSAGSESAAIAGYVGFGRAVAFNKAELDEIERGRREVARALGKSIS